MLYAAAYRLAGLAGVAVLAGLVLALTYALVARFLIRRGGDPLLAYLVSMAAARAERGPLAGAAAPVHPAAGGAAARAAGLHRPPRRSCCTRRSSWCGPTCTAGSPSVLSDRPLRRRRGLIEGRLVRRPGPLVRPRAPPRSRRSGVALAASLPQPERLASCSRTSSASSATARSCGRRRSSCRRTSTTINGKIFLLALLAVIAALALEPAPAAGPRRCWCCWRTSPSPCSRSGTSSCSRSRPCRSWRCTWTRRGGALPFLKTGRRSVRAGARRAAPRARAP